MIGRSLIASVLSALLIGSAAPALAATGADAGDEGGRSAVAESKKDARGENAKGKGKGKGLDKRFPMKADEFKRRTEARLARAREKVAALLDRRNVTDAEREQALERFDEGAAKVRAAAERVGKDGTVTVEEAKQVREVAKAERKAMKEEVAEARKDKKGKAKGKDKNKKA